MESLNTETSLKIEEHEGRFYVVLTQTVVYPEERKESTIVLSPESFDQIIKEYQGYKCATNAILNVSKKDAEN